MRNEKFKNEEMEVEMVVTKRMIHKLCEASLYLIV